MARYRIDLTNGQSLYEEAHRAGPTDTTFRLERMTAGRWSEYVEYPLEEVDRVSRRHTELNGMWSWARIYPGADSDRASAARLREPAGTRR